MRLHPAAAFGLAFTFLPAVAMAQGKPLPPASTDVMPPIALTITMEDGKPVCAPAELLVPANTNVAMNVTSQANADVTITIPDQFANGLVLHADGDLVHVASEHGYLVKRNGKGTLKLRTEGPGQVKYACTATTNRSQPFTGEYIRKAPAG
ncbi:anaerobic typically selenocysteine-containing protein [Methylobacterium komagatae]|uniref:Anaerobic typically selenocysteine-containing protein n=1 Tax=Methylobacterium komagatae TaxID=374425 RepID=A0ABW2BCY0_9HYPH